MDNRTKGLLALAVFLAIIIGLLVWYMFTHPAPGTESVATSTPTALGPQHLADSGQYYDIDTTYPGSTVLAQTASASADAEAVAVMKQFQAEAIASFKADSGLNTLTAEDAKLMNLGGDRKYALSMEYKAYQSPASVSYVYTIFADTAGAHPNTYYRTFTFDLKTGKELQLIDLFKPGANYLATLSSISRAKLPAMIAERENVSVAELGTDMITDGTKANNDSFQSFYLEGANLVIIFPPYQVGPYVLGTVLLPIPLKDLASILNPTYLGK